VIGSAAQFKTVKLIGYQVTRDRVMSGEPLEVVTYSRKSIADAPSPPGVMVLQSPDGHVVGSSEMRLGNDLYPAEVWQPDEIVATRFSVPTQTDRPTVARLNLHISTQLAILSRVTVYVDRPCKIDRVVDVTFGGAIKLTGYRIDEGPVPQIVLCWQAINSTPVDYTVFVHVPNGGSVISGDGQPVGGNYPTSAWQPGDVVEDVHLLPVSGDLKIPRGSIGLYRLDTGERLSIDGTSATEFELTK
jgi:hypothetical protein